MLNVYDKYKGVVKDILGKKRVSRIEVEHLVENILDRYLYPEYISEDDFGDMKEAMKEIRRRSNV